MQAIREKVSIPIAFKMNARFTNPASVAMRMQSEGVNGLVTMVISVSNLQKKAAIPANLQFEEHGE